MGIIGLGKMGRFHLIKCLSLPGVQVAGVYEPDSARAAAVHQETGVALFPTLDELLFEVDAAIIASPTAHHFDGARRALQAGVPVLVEKPVALRSEDAEALVKLAEERNLVLQVGMLERFRFAALARGCLLQAPTFVETHRLNAALPREKIDVVSDLMIHDLDLVLSLFNEDPIRVSATGLSVVTDQTDLAHAHLEFPGGGMASLNVSRLSKKPQRTLRVFSPHAYSSFDFQANTLVQIQNAHGELKQLEEPSRQLDPLLDQTSDFFQCIRKGRQPLVSGQDGARVLRCIELILSKIADHNHPAHLSSISRQIPPSF